MPGSTVGWLASRAVHEGLGGRWARRARSEFLRDDSLATRQVLSVAGPVALHEALEESDHGGPMDRALVAAWLAAYERAWRTPGTDALGEIFTHDATYSTGPFERPFEGLDEIARMWEAERQGPDEVFTMTSGMVAVEGDTAVVRVEVDYDDTGRPTYRDLWVIRLDASGRCRAFEEWPFWPEGEPGVVAGTK